MNRRDFLRRLVTGAAGAMVLDPEQLLWVPNRRTYFDFGAIVAPDEFDLFTAEALRVLEDRLAFARLVSRNYDDNFNVGKSISIHKPARFA